LGSADPRLGLEASVNITVGLPFIRTSVGQGMAFNIAGTGKADESNMLEVLRLSQSVGRFAK
jgi:4-hydroxythreonine-4-phosphate dehydrogenase